MDSIVSNKLNSLQDIQALDKRLDEIKTIRGSLPEEINDIENTLEELNLKSINYQENIESIDKTIFDFNEAIKASEELIIRYNNQIENVRNNREYNALNKERESQELDIKVYEKRKSDLYEKIELLKNNIVETKESIEELKISLSEKKVELDEIMNESDVEEKAILKKREKAIKVLDSKLLAAYEKLRKNAKNGFAVVDIERSACGGCFTVVQPQKFFDVKERKKIVFCEHCGRVLSNVIEDFVEKPKPRRGRRKLKK